MLRAYEGRWGVTFDWVIRIRTDMFILAPLAQHSTFAEGAHLVRGMVLYPAAVNDQTVVISRVHAAAYFNLIDEFGCDRSSNMSYLDDDSKLIVRRLALHGVPLWTLVMPYVLLRPGLAPGTFHFDCWRLFAPSVAPAAHHSLNLPWNATPKQPDESGGYARFFAKCCVLGGGHLAADARLDARSSPSSCLANASDGENAHIR